MSRPVLLRLLVLAALAAAVAGCSRQENAPANGSAPANGTATSKAAEKRSPIVIGEYGSLTGSTATFGVSTKNGIDLAVQEANAAGGVLGRPVQVNVQDDRGKPDETATVVTRLINQDRVVAVLGEVASKLSLTAGPICQRSQIPMITPASTNPAVTKTGDYIFRICFIDPFQGAVMAKFARTTLKASKAAILYDVSQDYSKGLADYFKQTFTKLGGKIVQDSSFTSGDPDFKAQLTSIRANEPDVVFVPGYYTEVGLIAKQAREIGLTVPLLGGDGWDSPELIKIGGKALENTYYSNHYSVEDTAPQVKEFVQKYRAKYGDAPDAMAALGYDAARILFDAIKRAGTTDAKPLRDAIAKTTDYQGVTGKISLDADRNATKPAAVLQIKDGKVHFVQTVAP